MWDHGRQALLSMRHPNLWLSVVAGIGAAPAYITAAIFHSRVVGTILSALSYVVFLSGCGLAGWNASRRRGSLGSGATAGLVVAIIYAVITLPMELMTLISGGFSKSLQAAAAQNHIGMATILTSLAIGFIGGFVLFIALGGAAGLAGGYLGARQAGYSRGL